MFARNAVYLRPCVDARLAAKAEGDNGTLEGYLAVFNNVDHGGERFVRGAFAKSITERVPAGKVPLMVRHFAHGGDTTEVVGTIISAKEDDHGLFVKANFASTNLAQETRKLVGEGHVRGLSIGFVPIRWAEVREDDRYIVEHQESKIAEGTITARPMNELAQITAAKSLHEQLQNFRATDALSRMDGVAMDRLLSKMEGVLEAFFGEIQEVGAHASKTTANAVDLHELETRLAEADLALREV